LTIESPIRIPQEGTGRFKVFKVITEGKAPIWDTRAIAKESGLSTRQVTIARSNLRGDGYLSKPTPELTRLTRHTHTATVFPLIKEYREMGLSPREIQLAVKTEKEIELSENSVHSAIVYGTKAGNLRELSEEEKQDIWRDANVNILTPEEASKNVIAVLELRKRLLENNQPLPNNRLEWKKAIGRADYLTLYDRESLINEWLQLTQMLGHDPSYRELRKLKREGHTKFSVGVYQKEFGEGSFAKAKEILAYFSSIQEFAATLLQNPSKILTRSVLEKDVKAVHATIMSELSSILSASSIEEVEERTKALNGKISEIKRGLNAKMHEYDLRIGEDEKSMWSYAVEHNLLPKMLQGNMLTHQEIDLLRRYFENGIIGKKLTVTIFDRFTVATAKIA
jgi:hypothetical protein